LPIGRSLAYPTPFIAVLFISPYCSPSAHQASPPLVFLAEDNIRYLIDIDNNLNLIDK